MLAVWIVFTVTYFGLAAGRFPGLRTDRAGIAVAGAAAMLALGAVRLEELPHAIDLPTIALLFGMMAVVAVLQIAGFFDWVTEHLAARATSSHRLLAAVIGLSGVLSAFLVNDVVCVAFTPLVLALCRRLGKTPIPFLIGLATASNIGSVATITGNPQNILIGSMSGIAYLRFFTRLAPVAGLGLIVDYAVISLVYRRALRDTRPVAAPPRREHVRWPLFVKSVAVTGLAVAGFFAGLPIAIVALVAASLLLLDRLRPERVYRRIDWPLLVLFCGLFVVVHAFEQNVVRGWGIENWHWLLESPVVLVSLLSVALSNLVSNVPAVLLFKPLMAVIPQKETAWLALSMSSTLAGNFTLLGSVANLIVVESARRAGTRLGFVEYLKVGVPVTVVTTALGVVWLRFFVY